MPHPWPDGSAGDGRFRPSTGRRGRAPCRGARAISPCYSSEMPLDSFRPGAYIRFMFAYGKFRRPHLRSRLRPGAGLPRRGRALAGA